MKRSFLSPSIYLYILATYTVLYSETDPSALAKYSSYVSIRLSLILLLIYLSVSMLCYAIVEIHIRWKEYHEKKCAVAISHTNE